MCGCSKSANRRPASRRPADRRAAGPACRRTSWPPSSQPPPSPRRMHSGQMTNAERMQLQLLTQYAATARLSAQADAHLPQAQP